MWCNILKNLTFARKLNVLKKYKLIAFVVLLALIGNSYQSQAQQRRTIINLPKYDMAPYHFGFILAGNQMLLSWKPAIDGSFTSSNSSIMDSISVARNTYGFAVGIVGNLRLSNHFDLRLIPTLSFGDREIRFVDNSKIDPVHKISMNSVLVQFPLHVKYRSKRLNNIAAYLIGGINPAIEMGRATKPVDKLNDELIDLNRGDVFADVGVGFDFYTSYFKFGVEAKMSYGLTNIIYDNPLNKHIYIESLSELRNKVFQISFTFE